MTTTSDHLDLFKTCNRLLNILVNLVFKYRCTCLDTFALFHVKISELTLLTLRAKFLFQELLTLQHALHLNLLSLLENSYSERMHPTWNLPFIRLAFQALSVQISTTLTTLSFPVRCDVFLAKARSCASLGHFFPDYIFSQDWKCGCVIPKSLTPNNLRHHLSNMKYSSESYLI